MNSAHDNETIDLSIVIPAYNEERRLPPTLIDMIDFLDARGDNYELIVVNDGSTDATTEVVHKIAKLRPAVKLIEQHKNLGKGLAVKTGVLNARGTVILMADADGATPIQEIIRLERALANGIDVAIGSRAIYSKDTTIKTSFHRKFLGRIFNAFVNILVVPGITDTQCGFKLFSARAAKFLFSHQSSDRFSFDVELLYLARRAGMHIEEIPINWHNIPESKINLIVDSAQMFLDILRMRWMHREVTPALWHSFPA